jgi:phosphoenolpyruvate carboxykinase (ATP)
VLSPREAWKVKAAYDVKAKDLAGRFVKNFQKYKDMPAHIVNAGPKA